MTQALQINWQLVKTRGRHVRLRVVDSTPTVRVSAPVRLNQSQLAQLALEHGEWIRLQAQQLRAQEQQAADLSQLRLWGQRVSVSFQLSTRDDFCLTGDRLVLYHRKTLSETQAKNRINQLLRQLLHQAIGAQIEHWATQLGLTLPTWHIKQMRTRWGSCNMAARRIWLAQSLVHYPAACLTLVIVHELVHLHEAKHNARFYQLLAQQLPDWQQSAALLRQRLH